MKKVILVLSCAMLALMPVVGAAQTGSGTGAGTGVSGDKQATTSSSSSQSSTTTQKDGRSTTTTTTKIEGAQGPKFVRTLTNVQVELTLTDQLGNGTPEKKTVSMIVSSGNWGKIRSAGSVRPPGDAPYGVDLNVDARPFVSLDGQIQLELTVNYSPPIGEGEKDKSRRPTGINQSQTLILQNGKPMVISQAADPVSDRKVTVEAKATILK